MLTEESISEAFVKRARGFGLKRQAFTSQRYTHLAKVKISRLSCNEARSATQIKSWNKDSDTSAKNETLGSKQVNNQVQSTPVSVKHRFPMKIWAPATIRRVTSREAERKAKRDSSRLLKAFADAHIWTYYTRPRKSMVFFQ